MNPRSGYYLGLGAFYLLVVFLFGGIAYQSPPYSHWDLSQYLAMAEAFPGIDREVNLPFAGRLLGPALVSVSNLPAAGGFRILTLVVGLAVVCLLFRFLLNRNISEGPAFVATALFMLNKHFFGYVLWNYFQLNDMLGFLSLLLLTEAMFRKRWIIFSLALVLGVMAREIVLVMVPVTLVYLYDRKILGEHWKIAVSAMVPGLVVFAALRVMLPDSGMGILETFRYFSVKAGAWQTWYYLFINSVVPVSFLPIIFWARTRAFFRTNRFVLVLMALVSLSSFLGSNNERLIAPIFLSFYWLTAEILDKEVHGRWLLGCLLICGLVGSFHQTMTRSEFISHEMMMVTTLGSLLVATGAFIVFRVSDIRKK